MSWAARKLFTHQPLWLRAWGALLVWKQATRTLGVTELLSGVTADFFHINNMLTLNMNAQQQSVLTVLNPAAFFQEGTVTEELLSTVSKEEVWL